MIGSSSSRMPARPDDVGVAEQHAVVAQQHDDRDRADERDARPGELAGGCRLPAVQLQRDVDAIDHREPEAGEQRRDRHHERVGVARAAGAARCAARRRARSGRRSRRGTSSRSRRARRAARARPPTALIANAKISRNSSRLRCVCGTRMRRSARTTAVSVDTASVPVGGSRGAHHPPPAVSLMEVTMRRASSSDVAEIVCSTVARAKSESESSGMPVSSYGVDSEIGPMSCWMPRIDHDGVLVGADEVARLGPLVAAVQRGRDEPEHEDEADDPADAPAAHPPAILLDELLEELGRRLEVRRLVRRLPVRVQPARAAGPRGGHLDADRVRRRSDDRRRAGEDRMLSADVDEDDRDVVGRAAVERLLEQVVGGAAGREPESERLRGVRRRRRRRRGRPSTAASGRPAGSA